MRNGRNLSLAILLFAAVISVPSNADSPFHHSGKELPGIQLPDHPQSILGDDSPGCNQFAAHYGTEENPTNSEQKNQSSMRVKLLHHHHREQNRHKSKTTLLLESLARDRSRLHAFHQRKQSNKARYLADLVANSSDVDKSRALNFTSAETSKAELAAETLVAKVESGVSMGSGEYFIDVFIGTPPRHFQLIMDTGSDLNWVQCLPCVDCYPQGGPLFNASLSSTYRPVSCSAAECSLVESGAAGQSCTNSTTCKYFYWYGDRSNTTGDLALETFTVNVSGHVAAQTLAVGGVVFGCGHANRGLFHGAAGLLGLGRGQLSFASQLRRQYGHKFSYCLVDRESNLSVSSTLVFGEDRRLSAHPDFQSTAFLSDGAGGTFYFLNVSSVTVGGERVNISSAAWDISAGGIIIDSGTTLTYLAQPAYDVIKSAFDSKIPYARGEFSPLELCYNVSGVAEVKLPEFSFHFGDGAVWKFPVENYFIQPDPEESVVCLAVLMTPAGSLSILGNYQQQNFHVMYDVEESRLGFAPMACADV